jgi:hypothetical protein
MMHLNHHYYQRGHTLPIAPIIKIIPILPRQAGTRIAPSDNFVFGALMKTIMEHDPPHIRATQDR